MVFPRQTPALLIITVGSPTVCLMVCAVAFMDSGERRSHLNTCTFAGLSPGHSRTSRTTILAPLVRAARRSQRAELVMEKLAKSEVILLTTLSNNLLSNTPAATSHNHHVLGPVILVLCPVV